MNTIIKVKCLKHIYPDNTEVNICGLDFVVRTGNRIVILGPNGTGKTTLLAHILGLLKPLEGMIEVFGKSPYENFKENRKKIGVVFQNVDEQIIGPTVYDDIAFSLRNEGLNKKVIDEKVKNIANKLGIESILSKIPHYLSGGQKRKVALAGAMAMSPELLIMDEPFDGLDSKSKYDIIKLLNDLNQNMSVTTIITTHDINIVPEISDIVYIINKGNIVKSDTPENIFADLDTLKDANIEPPIITELFNRLKKNGLEVNSPLTVDEAEKEILKLFNRA